MVIVHRGASPPHVVRVDKHAMSCKLDTRGALGQNERSKARVGYFCSLEGPMRLSNRPNLVQQPCSNPGKTPEISGKALEQKYACLQVFCKLWKAPAKYRAAFARRRSGVRIPSAPLLEYAALQVERWLCLRISARFLPPRTVGPAGAARTTVPPVWRSRRDRARYRRRSALRV
jgi:hypothetical protein